MLNGREVEVIASPAETLQSALRDKLSQTATKSGCKQGGCGSCTVLVNGEPMLSCLQPVEDVAGEDVSSLEGLTPIDGLHPNQQACVDNYAIQCGFCSPGMIMTAKALLDENSNPDREQIIDAIAGNFCRCTGYAPIVDAVADAASRMKNGK
jgi:carbon-monoxide dehydrogenase small subunit